ncbi:MAG: hypothetical protein KDD61_10485 [Bdellovibrionales bacterium]|nr:hypothetical protein [Bdellovibrionales bacterium]
MDQEQLEFIEKYQILYEENPHSKVFAPLADAYRRAGMLEESLDVALQGVKLHPKFAGGQLALARTYIDKNELELAIEHLQKAIECSPENILAISLLAETQLKTRRPKEALSTYKMLLFLSPNNEKALKAVKKLESISADEYDDELFEMKPIRQAVEAWEKLDFEDFVQDEEDTHNNGKSSYFLERFVSLIDAYLSRNNIEKALETLNEAEQQFGQNPELEKRRKLLSPHSSDIEQKAPKKSSQVSRIKEQQSAKIKFLQSLLERINERRRRIPLIQ